MTIVLRLMTALCMLTFIGNLVPLIRMALYGGTTDLSDQLLAAAVALALAALFAATAEIIRLLRKIADR